jgi:peptidoglycan hydrolase CwlO-like protein
LYADLDDTLRILQDKASFIQAQKEDIQTLLEQIDETKSLITTKIEEIRTLKYEIKLCDIEIAKLLAEIEGLN